MSNKIEKLKELIKPFKICMLTTIQHNNELHSRPMAILGDDFNGEFWFFTNIISPKIYEIKDNSNVNLSFSEPKDNTYISISGKAKIIKDQDKFKQFWNPMCKLWFPKGITDPELSLINVQVLNAEYWDSASNIFIKIIDFIKAMSTGNPQELGDNEKIDLGN